MKYLIMLCVFTFGFLAFGQELIAPETVSDALLLSLQTKTAYEGQSYAVAIVGAFMLITFAVKKLFIKTEQAKELIPVFTAVLGAMTGAGASIATGHADPMAGALGGLLLGNSASGLYDATIKPLKKRFKENNEK